MAVDVERRELLVRRRDDPIARWVGIYLRSAQLNKCMDIISKRISARRFNGPVQYGSSAKARRCMSCSNFNKSGLLEDLQAG
jgi:hypothetical protein